MPSWCASSRKPGLFAAPASTPTVQRWSTSPCRSACSSACWQALPSSWHVPAQCCTGESDHPPCICGSDLAQLLLAAAGGPGAEDVSRAVRGSATVRSRIRASWLKPGAVVKPNRARVYITGSPMVATGRFRFGPSGWMRPWRSFACGRRPWRHGSPGSGRSGSHGRAVHEAGPRPGSQVRGEGLAAVAAGGNRTSASSRRQARSGKRRRTRHSHHPQCCRTAGRSMRLPSRMGRHDPVWHVRRRWTAMRSPGRTASVLLGLSPLFVALGGIVSRCDPVGKEPQPTTTSSSLPSTSSPPSSSSSPVLPERPTAAAETSTQPPHRYGNRHQHNRLPDQRRVPRPRGLYDNCDDARATGVAPLRRGDPGYALHPDRDRGGVACGP